MSPPTSPLSFTAPTLYSPFGGATLLHSRFGDIPLGAAVQDWGVPLWPDSPKVYVRMNPGFTVPVDGVPGTTSIALEPQVSPPTGKFPVEVEGQTEYVSLEFVPFI